MFGHNLPDKIGAIITAVTGPKLSQNGFKLREKKVSFDFSLKNN